MSVGDVLACMSEIRQAKTQRNKAVVALQLDATADDDRLGDAHSQR